MSLSFDLSNFLKETNIDGALIISLKGEIVEVEGIDNSDNIAAMVGVILKMVSEFSSDLGIGNLKQILLRAEEGIFIINKLDENNILGVHSKDIGKVGLIMMSINKIIQ